MDALREVPLHPAEAGRPRSWAQGASAAEVDASHEPVGQWDGRTGRTVRRCVNGPLMLLRSCGASTFAKRRAMVDRTAGQAPPFPQAKGSPFGADFVNDPPATSSAAGPRLTPELPGR